MGYTVRDLASYGGFIAGMSLTFLLLGAAGVQSYILKLVVGLVIGITLGYLGDRAYRKREEEKWW